MNAPLPPRRLSRPLARRCRPATACWCGSAPARRIAPEAFDRRCARRRAVTATASSRSPRAAALQMRGLTASIGDRAVAATSMRSASRVRRACRSMPTRSPASIPRSLLDAGALAAHLRAGASRASVSGSAQGLGRRRWRRTPASRRGRGRRPADARQRARGRVCASTSRVAGDAQPRATLDRRGRRRACASTQRLRLLERDRRARHVARASATCSPPAVQRAVPPARSPHSRRRCSRPRRCARRRDPVGTHRDARRSRGARLRPSPSVMRDADRARRACTRRSRVHGATRASHRAGPRAARRRHRQGSRRARSPKRANGWASSSHADDPRRQIVACPGAPACAAAEIPARALAAEIAPTAPRSPAATLRSACLGLRQGLRPSRRRR